MITRSSRQEKKRKLRGEKHTPLDTPGIQHFSLSGEGTVSDRRGCMQGKATPASARSRVMGGMEHSATTGVHGSDLSSFRDVYDEVGGRGRRYAHIM